ncbi:hypothetical protein CEXT_635741 [Caerostris extrusa]|uniref:Uncharacterized protein n=1 Tax=Caerostris extrusa TaxID=172846 RepID=A0AAV4RR47_CAEEX|nr:hypothetical protein CEXT_635741 [Caerostris extrusa]
MSPWLYTWSGDDSPWIPTNVFSIIAFPYCRSPSRTDRCLKNLIAATSPGASLVEEIIPITTQPHLRFLVPFYIKLRTFIWLLERDFGA